MCWPGLGRIWGLLDEVGGRGMEMERSEVDFEWRRVKVAGSERWEMFRWAMRRM